MLELGIPATKMNTNYEILGTSKELFEDKVSPLAREHFTAHSKPGQL